MRGDARLWEPVTDRIIGCAFRVANALGPGFVEEVSRVPAGVGRYVDNRAGSTVTVWSSGPWPWPKPGAAAIAART